MFSRAATATAALAGLIFAITPPVFAADQPVNPETPAAEALALARTIEANGEVRAVPIDDGDRCATTVVPESERKRQLAVANALRAFVDLEPLELLPASSPEWAAAQQASITQALQSDIRHGYPSSWPCYTAAGSTSSNESNLALGWGGYTPRHLEQLVADESVASLGHRMWFFHPHYDKLAFGAAVAGPKLTNTSVLTQVVTPDSVRNTANAVPATLAWPAPGYFPLAQVPSQWSFGASGVADLGGATVSITDPAGKTRRVKVSHAPWEFHGLQTDQISFGLPGGIPDLASGQVATYTVTVRLAEKTWTYPVRIFGGAPDKGKVNTFLVNDWRSRTAHAQFHIPAAPAVFAGDFDGDGIDTVGTRSGSSTKLFEKNGADSFYSSFGFGRAGDEVYVGDWDGDGIDTLALRRGNTFYLASTNAPGTPVTSISYGRAGDEVLVGDWDGNGTDTFAVRRGNQYFISNTVKSGNADTVIRYGRAGDIVLSGDWDGKGGDTLTVRRGNQYFMKNSIASGNADTVLGYGRATDQVIVGDWNGDGKDTLGVYRP